jgi:hypothetical protein
MSTWIDHFGYEGKGGTGCRLKAGVTANLRDIRRLYEIANLIVCPHCRLVLKDRYGDYPRPAEVNLPDGFRISPDCRNEVLSIDTSIESKAPIVFIEHPSRKTSNARIDEILLKIAAW